MAARARYVGFRVDHRGNRRSCNICGWRGSDFFPLQGSGNVECPRCHSKPRHRLLRLVLDERDAPARGARILHVAPKGEDGLARWFKSVAGSYLSIDKGGVWNTFEDGGAMQQMDLTSLPLPDNAFDFIMCAHVLENIEDDMRAMREILRVLAPGGIAALQVQIQREVTIRAERRTVENYWHAWLPGLDYFDRYRAVGFNVYTHSARDVDSADHERLALSDELIVPLCTK